MKELHKALLKVQQELKTIQTDAKGNFGNYASLEQVLEKSEEALHRNGLLLTQYGENILGNKENLLLTTIVHVETGQKITSSFLLTPEKPGPQGFGAAMTYFRRYSILALLGKATGDDPDSAIQKTYDAPESRSVGKGTASNQGVVGRISILDKTTKNGWDWKDMTYGDALEKFGMDALERHGAKLMKKALKTEWEKAFLVDLIELKDQSDAYNMANACENEPDSRFEEKEPEDLRNRFGP